MLGQELSSELKEARLLKCGTSWNKLYGDGYGVCVESSPSCEHRSLIRQIMHTESDDSNYLFSLER